MKVVFIINEKAGNGAAKRKWKNLRKSLQIPYKLEYTEYPGHATEIAKRYATIATKFSDKHLLIAIGGDGTVHEVVQGVITTGEVYIGAISAGSGNDFGRGYETFTEASEIVRFTQQHSNAKVMDIGVLQKNDETLYYINNAGIGFDAYISKISNESKLKRYFNFFRLGKLTYVFFLLKALNRFKTFSIKVIHNGEEQVYDNVWLVVASNQPYFGGGMKISPSSNPSDHNIELTIIYNISRLKLLLLFSTVFFGKHTGIKAVQQYSGEAFEVDIHGEVIGHTDGEFAGITEKNQRIHFGVMHHAWHLARKTS
ncbi:diacylglycerol kinase family lipid kinase [Viridibacillus sp. YIM B01967]|uniref:Diacylglycerol kinase family lipid kinase n=1 Tax=Viridibacillus soli TaxID=2798301 RepID=A0ABS1H9I1_9BACL|nr:diacylglycerol kinase family protein [Viridibacillus soli]MBK3496063.1 diacylglycerol kinase family lipid kinase [Viridibacillus soli]